MALQVHFTGPLENHYKDSVVYQPQDLVSHFKENNTLEIKKDTHFYVWLKGDSLEWAENDPGKNFSRLKMLFNKTLQPVGKSLSKISTCAERIQLGTFNDGFYLFTLDHPFKLIAQ